MICLVSVCMGSCKKLPVKNTYAESMQKDDNVQPQDKAAAI